MAVSNASLGNLFLTIKADTKGALGDIQRVIREAEKAAKAVDALNKKAGRVQPVRSSGGAARGSSSSGGTRSRQAELSDLDKVANKLKAVQEVSKDIGKSNDAVGAELASDSVLKRITRLRAELTGLLPSLKTNDERARVQALLGTLEQVNKQTREARRVAKFQPDKVGQAGSVAEAVKLVRSEEAAVLKARQEARAKGIAYAKTYREQLRRQQEAADKAAQTAAGRAARDAQKAADRAASVAKKEAERAAKDAAKLAAQTSSKLKAGASGLTTGLFSNIGKGALKSAADFSAAAAALRYGNVFGGIASGARAVAGVFTNATKTVTDFGEAVGGVSAAAGPLGVILGGALAAGLVAVGIYAAKAVVSFAKFGAQAAFLGITLKSLFTTGFSGATELEKSSLTLEAVLGKRAKAEEAYLIQRDRASLYDFQGLQELDRTLLAFNVTNDETRRGLVDTLVTLGTVGGRSIDQLQFASRALGQISANGTPLRQDILQLVQSLGVSEKVLQSLPEYAGKSTAELRKLLEQGLIPSTTFFKALGVYAEQFGPIAAKAAGTFEGQVNNIKDTLKTGLSKAFLDTGVLAAAANLASKILAIISTIDFRPIGEGFRAVVNGIANGLGAITGPGSGATTLKTFFEQTLPRALYNVAAVAQIVTGFIAKIFSSWVDGIGNAAGANTNFAMSTVAVINSFVGIATMVAGVVKFLRLSIVLGKAVIGVFVNLGKTIGNILAAVGYAADGDFAGAGNALKQIGKDWSNYNKDVGKGQRDAINQYASFVADINALADKAAEAIFAPKFQAQDPTGTGLPDQQSVLNEENQKADELRQKVADLRNQIFDLTRRVYGARSQLEQGLLGTVGFDATKDSIAQIGDQVAETIRQLGNSRLAAAIDRQVQQLMGLAAMRDAVAKRLEEVNKRLDEAIQARDQFAETIRKQAVDFVNALNLEEKTVDAVRTFSSRGVTGYLVSQVKSTERYVDQMRKRLATFKDFQRKTQQLLARGLDKGLLEQLVAAGPEQAGTVVDQLVASGDDVISEVNSIQKELGQVAKDAGTTHAANFYQAGVDQARAQAAGLLSQIAYISSVAEMLGQAIYNAVVPYAQKTGAAIASAVSSAPRAAAGGGRATTAPAAPSRNPFAEFLLAARQQVNDAVTGINQRTLLLTTSKQFTADQIQNDRKFFFADLMKRYSSLIKVPDSTGYNIGIYIGGQKIAEYVDVALRDEINRKAAADRRAAGPAPSYVPPGPNWDFGF